MESYQERDHILASLAASGRLGAPVGIKVIVDENFVCLYIGPRDFQWSRKTGKLVGCGTMMSQHATDKNSEEGSIEGGCQSCGAKYESDTPEENS